MASAVSRRTLRPAAGVLALEVIVLLGMTFTARFHPHSHPLDGIAYLLAAVAAGALGLAWRWPPAAVGLALASIMVYHWRGYAPGAVDLALMVTLYRVASPSQLRRALLLGAVTVLGYLLLSLVDPPALSLDGVLLAGVAVVASLGLGLAVSGQRAHSRARREEDTQRRLTEERLRIARELHDVVSHSISTINVQAGVAVHVMDQRPEQAREALLTIKRTSKETLQELRGILQVLRRVDEVDPRSPAPGLAQLETLIETTRSAGVRTRAEIVGPLRPLPPSVDLAAYRVIQESLTNVIRHAGPATAEVNIIYEPSRLLIEVSDDGVGAAGLGPDKPGHGLEGMRERVAASGGGLQAGPRPGGGFSVRVWFPINGTAA